MTGRSSGPGSGAPEPGDRLLDLLANHQIRLLVQGAKAGDPACGDELIAIFRNFLPQIAVLAGQLGLAGDARSELEALLGYFWEALDGFQPVKRAAGRPRLSVDELSRERAAAFDMALVMAGDGLSPYQAAKKIVQRRARDKQKNVPERWYVEAYRKHFTEKKSANQTHDDSPSPPAQEG